MNLVNVCRQGSRHVAIAFITTIFAFVAACGGGGSSSPPTLSSIAVTAAASSVAAGATDQLTATGTYSDGSTKDLTSSVTWTSSSTATATVSSAGLLKGVAAGSVTVTAASGSISGMATVTVTAPVVSSVSVSVTSPVLLVGQTEQATATATLTDGSTQDVTATAMWASSNAAAASVTNPGGLLTALAAGATNITATASGKTSAAVAITVNVPAGPTLVSIAVTPATPANLVVGQTQQFTATGTYSDNSTKDVTTSATWASDNTAVATIGANTGVATGVAAGTANITATVGAIASTKVPLTVVTAPTSFVLAANAYSPASTAGTVSQFSLGSGGALTALTPATVAAGENPLVVTTDPKGAYAYVLNEKDSTVGQYTVMGGLLTAMTPATAALAGTFPRDIKVDPSGKFAFVTDIAPGSSGFEIEGFTIGSNGSLTLNANSPWGAHTSAYNLAFSPSGQPYGQMLYVSCATSSGSIQAFSMDSSGNLTKVGPANGVQAGDTPQGLVVHPNGQYLYVANNQDLNVQLFTISSTDGSLTPGNGYPTGGKNVANATAALAITPDGKYLIATNTNSKNVSVFAISSTDGSLGTATLVAAGDTPDSISIDPTGTYVYVGNLGDGTISEYTFSAGTLTPVTGSPITSDPNNSGGGVTSVFVAP